MGQKILKLHIFLHAGFIKKLTNYRKEEKVESGKGVLIKDPGKKEKLGIILCRKIIRRGYFWARRKENEAVLM